MEFMEQMQSFAPIILMVVIFYFMLWRPQKKQQKRRQEMLNSMKTGAKVITIGGIYGTIVELHEDYVAYCRKDGSQNYPAVHQSGSRQKRRRVEGCSLRKKRNVFGNK